MKFDKKLKACLDFHQFEIAKRLLLYYYTYCLLERKQKLKILKDKLKAYFC